MLDVCDCELRSYLNNWRHMDAAEHLFRVASGLESMIVGEFEVLGQIKQGLETAEKAGMASLPLRHTFQTAIRTGRLVREQTGISRHALSASSVAEILAAHRRRPERVPDARDRRRRCRQPGGPGGAGAGASQIAVASRTMDRAKALAAGLNGCPTDLGDLDKELRRGNIVVTFAAAPPAVRRPEDRSGHGG